MVMLISRIDMRLIDEKILQYIVSRADPKTRRVNLTCDQISQAIGGCHRNTVLNATNRLQAAGRIKKEPMARRRDGSVYEVINDLG